MSWLKRLVGGKADAKPEVHQAPAPSLDPAAIEAEHRRLTAVRAAAYEELLGCQASAFFPSHELNIVENAPVMIDLFVYDLDAGSLGDVQVAVTNGMSDRRMVDAEEPSRWARRELIQYFRRCTPEYAKRLYTMAWVPHEEGLLLDTCHTIEWKRPISPSSPLTSGFFLQPLLRSQREWEITLEGDPVSLLWHVPITEAERRFKVEHGADALIDRMDAAELPWIFDEAQRPALLP